MLTKDEGRELTWRHPWLYHVVWRADDSTRETIASDGLVAGPPRHNWHPLWRPRAGHVYLAMHSYLTQKWLRVAGEDIYAVRTSHLMAAKISADEDHFIENKQVACDQFGIHRPPDTSLWALFKSVVPSFGDWADQVGLGSKSEQTVYSARQGSVAYAGVVPPKALLRWDTTVDRWVQPGYGDQP